jgi:hypothetical protein
MPSTVPRNDFLDCFKAEDNKTYYLPVNQHQQKLQLHMKYTSMAKRGHTPLPPPPPNHTTGYKTFRFILVVFDTVSSVV